MALYNKFNLFLDYLAKAKVNLSTDAIKVLLTNTAPTAALVKYADIAPTELTSGNGYATGGSVAPNPTLANNAGTESLTVGTTTFTSNTGPMGPFRYVVYYDSTAADQPLIAWFDYGSSVTLNGAAGETFAAAPAAALFQIA